MDREEKKKTENGAQKRPVHRRRPRPEGSSAGKADSAPVRRRTEGSAAGKADSTPVRRRTEGSAAGKAEGTPVRRRAEGSAAGKAEGTPIRRRAEGSTAGKAEGTPVRRRTDGHPPRRQKSAENGKRPGAAAEELRKVSRENEGGHPSPGSTGRKKNAGSRPDQQGRPGSARKKRQQKRARFNVISSVVLVAAVCVFVFSLYQLIAMLVPYYSGGKIYDEIKDLAITADEDGSGFKVDFDALLKENSDTVAWIRFDEPSIINYPVVKSADNEDYLTRTFTANDNKLGAIFMDYRNSNDFSDRNTFIYGHHLNVGGEMFSELLKYEDESFCKEHPNFYIYTPDGKVRTYTVFSAGVVKDTADNYKIDYASDAEYEEYLKLCQDSSNYQVDVELNAQSQIISLSTCTNVRDDERFLVQGVLTATD